MMVYFLTLLLFGGLFSGPNLTMPVQVTSHWLANAAFAAQVGNDATICLNAFNDENGNGVHDADEDYMAGITFTVSRDGELIDTAISAGRAEPICFEGLVPGVYEVAQQIPPRLELTTADTAVIEVNAGQTLGLVFGSRLRPQPTPATDPAGADTLVETDPPLDVAPEPVAETAEPTPDTAPRSLAALSGLIVLFLGIVLLGVLLFIFLRRQTA